MAKCDNCGAKIGFLSSPSECSICRKSGCRKCHGWLVSLEGISSSLWGSLDEFPVCSVGCANEVQQHYIETLTKKAEAVLFNIANNGVLLSQRIGNSNSSFYASDMKEKPTIADKGSRMIPEAKWLFDEAMKGLSARTIPFKRDSDNV